MKILSLYFLIYMVAISCNTKTQFRQSSDRNGTDKFQESELESISWGSGGGFTNQVVRYSLDSKGVVMQKLNSSDFQRLTQFDQELTKSLFESAENIPAHLKNINKPGNIYSFLNLNKKEHSRQFTWGSVDVKMDSTIINLFQLLNSSVQSSLDK